MVVFCDCVVCCATVLRLVSILQARSIGADGMPLLVSWWVVIVFLAAGSQAAGRCSQGQRCHHVCRGDAEGARGPPAQE